MNKIFLLGVGCQKGGTTWVHDQLQRHEAVDMGFAKEYHVLDSHFTPEFCPYGPPSRSLPQRALHWLGASLGSNRHRLELFRMHPEHYFDYFANLASGNADLMVTGDITPSYAGLPASVFRSVQESMNGRGLDVRVLFLLRDPVDRVISSVRMSRRLRSEAPSRSSSQVSESEEIEAHFETPAVAMRTSYASTLATLESVFSPDQIYVEFYERLFREDSFRALSEFLRIDYREPDFGRQVNVSRTSVVIGDDLRKRIFERYHDTYAEISSRYGRDLLKSLWPSYQQFG